MLYYFFHKVVQNVRNPCSVYFCVRVWAREHTHAHTHVCTGDEVRKVLWGVLFLYHAKERRLYFSRKPWKVLYPGKRYDETTASHREFCRSKRGESWMGTSVTQTSETSRQRDNGDCPRAVTPGRKMKEGNRKQVDVWGVVTVHELLFLYAYFIISPPSSPWITENQCMGRRWKQLQHCSTWRNHPWSLMSRPLLTAHPAGSSGLGSYSFSQSGKKAQRAPCCDMGMNSDQVLQMPSAVGR